MSANTTTRTNIVFIAADDLGFARLGRGAGHAPVCPVIDQLAANGVWAPRRTSDG